VYPNHTITQKMADLHPVSFFCERLNRARCKVVLKNFPHHAGLRLSVTDRNSVVIMIDRSGPDKLARSLPIASVPWTNCPPSNVKVQGATYVVDLVLSVLLNSGTADAVAQHRIPYDFLAVCFPRRPWRKKKAA